MGYLALLSHVELEWRQKLQFVVAKDVSEACLSMTVDVVSEVSKLPEGTAGGVSFSYLFPIFLKGLCG